MTIKYKTSKLAWGLEGVYEDYGLVFSGGLNQGKKNPPANVDVYAMFSKNAKAAWRQAYALCKKRNNGGLALEDIFLALLGSRSVKNLFKRIQAGTSAAEALLKNYLKLEPAAPEKTLVQKIPFEAFSLAIKLHNHKIGSLMLLGALLKMAPQDNILQAIFSNIGLSLNKLEVLSAWMLDLDYAASPGSPEGKLLYCCRQAEGLEQHFGYFFAFPAIEQAVKLSSGQTLKDLEHKKALQLLVKAANLAKASGKKVISREMVRQVGN